MQIRLSTAALFAAVVLIPAAHAQTASETRTLVWDGSARLTNNLGGEFSYTQGPASRVVVTGDPDFVRHVVVRDGVVTMGETFPRKNWRDYNGPGIASITVTAPSVNSFVLNGGRQGVIRNYAQDALSLTVNGGKQVSVSGRAQDVTLTVNGGGSVDLAGLRAGNARIASNGSGDVAVAATGDVGVRIVGTGQVRLLTAPAKLHKHIIGSGSVIDG